MQLGLSIKLALVHRGRTAKSLADELGVSVQYVSRLSNGKSRPGIGQIEKISKALGYKPSEFIALGE